MLRLLLALLVVGLLAWWLLPRPRAGGDVVADRVQPMMRTLRKNGCDVAPATQSSIQGNTQGSAAASLKTLQAAIAECEARAAARAENAAASP